MDRFQSFGAQHLITVAGLVAAIAIMCAAGRRLGSAAARRYELSLGIAVALLWIGYQVYDTMHRGFDPGHSLPLQFCDLTAIVAALEFARPRRAYHALAWFWGVALASQAVLTPDLTAGPDTFGFWAFWFYHLFVVGAGVYAVAVRGFRPEWRDLRFAIGLALLYVAVMFTIDAVFGLNYGYVGRATPGQPTLLDHLGPWPIRVLHMVLLGAAAMVLLWLPWLLVRRRSPSA